MRVVIAALLLLAVSLIGLQSPVAASENPLEPLDISSPRATYESFIEQTRVIEAAALVYADDRTSANQAALQDELRKMDRLVDLSEVSSAGRREWAEATWTALADILMRVPLPDPDTVPDAEGALAADLTRWTLPGTEITLVRVESGDRAGGYVFSADTVADLPHWRDQVEGMPILAEDAEVTDWRGSAVVSTGWLIPLGLVDDLPTVFDDHILGNPLWKVLVSIVAAMLVSLLLAAWYRWIGSRGRRGTMTRNVLSLTTPIVMLVLVAAFEWFLEQQLNIGALAARFALVGTTIAFFVALAWTFRGLVRLVVEWVIVTPLISDGSYDAHLLRLMSRVVSVIGAIGILLYGANEIGIPALGLLAGVGIGGLIIGLAAQGTVENLIGGMTLFADKPFRVGDTVEIDQDRGKVELVGPRSTRIHKLDGTRLTIPNADIAAAKVTNLTQRRDVLFLHTIGVRYETTREQLEVLVERIREEMRKNPVVVKDESMPRVRLAGFGSSSIDIEVRAYIETNDYHRFMAVQEGLLLMFLRVVEEAGTSMAFPSSTTYLTRDTGIAGMPPSDADDAADPGDDAAGQAPEARDSAP